ncbi:SipW-dependent-type signal peptide-containing protein [Microbacterium sp. MPKO10]|uniref:SipW-dependent-type signal peptide-containing protein n=1 Tax=Microbacterium sp. MPKO10 TaxID=2989818 RepID=UPI002235DCEB|nr:SipW-dependent-type signal peptide-containing protein [Microbacterium sp. MPKO10]MCW4458675.1 SipW-dependent-type signal peptide-containing protein [Microbacterium sp. MPKO10]
MSQSTDATGTTRRRFTKIRAILAGGLVLGVGAAITLAVWNDSEFATGQFAAGNFGIEGSADGNTFSDHADEANAASLNFQVDADALSPDDSVYAGFAVQLVAGSDYAANVTISQDDSAAPAGTTTSYVYTTTATCNATAFASGTDTDVSMFALSAPTTPTYVCFQVTADDSLEQGATGNITWTFAAESTTTL